MPQPVTAAPRGERSLVAFAPALVVSVTAVFALPHQAGGFRLAKWGAFGFALAAVGVYLLARRHAAARLPMRPFALAGFMVSAAVLPVLASSLTPAHWPTALGLLSGLALFVVTVVALDDDDAARRASLVVLTATGSLCAVVVLAQAAGLRWLTSDVYTGLEFLAPGTFGNPNWAAAFLAPLAPLALALAVTAERRWLYYGVAALLCVATAATLSKGGVLALVAGMLVFAMLGRDVPRRRRVAIVVAALACVAVMLVVAWQHDFFVTETWLRGRLFLWRAALVLVGEHPLSGWGLGGYLPAYGAAAAILIDGNPDAFMPLSSVDFAHNDLLQFAAEGGILTAAAFVVVVVSAMVHAHRRADPLSRAVGAAVAALFVNGFADSPMRVPSTFVLFFFLLGWLSPTVLRAGGHRAVLVVVVLLGVIQGVRFTAGNAFWTLGRDALRNGGASVRYFERSRWFLPENGRSASQHARALARSGRIDAAIDAAVVAATLRFDFDDEIFRRDLQARALDRGVAIQQWQELSARFPGLVTPHLRLGALYLQTNDRAAAIAAYETALASSQPTPRAQAARTQAQAILRSLLSQAP